MIEEEPDVAHCEWCRDAMLREHIEGQVPLAVRQLDSEWLCEACSDKWARDQAETEADEYNDQHDG